MPNEQLSLFNLTLPVAADGTVAPPALPTTSWQVSLDRQGSEGRLHVAVLALTVGQTTVESQLEVACRRDGTIWRPEGDVGPGWRFVVRPAPTPTSLVVSVNVGGLRFDGSHQAFAVDGALVFRIAASWKPDLRIPLRLSAAAARGFRLDLATPRLVLEEGAFVLDALVTGRVMPGHTLHG